MVFGQKFTDKRNFIENEFELHLISDSGRCFGVIFQKLKINTVHKSIETAGNRNNGITRIDTGEFFLNFR